MEDTIDAVAHVSHNNIPLSIIIVGVGDESFANMVRLDGDDVAIRVGVKDLIQFVKYEEVR